MIPYVDSRKLSEGVVRFIRHALELFTNREAARMGGAGSPDPDHLAMLSASIKFASSDTEVLTSALEQQALRRLFRTALHLTQEARHDPRWPKLGFTTDPVDELELLSRRAEGVPYETSRCAA